MGRFEATPELRKAAYEGGIGIFDNPNEPPVLQIREFAVYNVNTTFIVIDAERREYHGFGISLNAAAEIVWSILREQLLAAPIIN